MKTTFHIHPSIWCYPLMFCWKCKHNIQQAISCRTFWKHCMSYKCANFIWYTVVVLYSVHIYRWWITCQILLEHFIVWFVYKIFIIESAILHSHKMVIPVTLWTIVNLLMCFFSRKSEKKRFLCGFYRQWNVREIFSAK